MNVEQLAARVASIDEPLAQQMRSVPTEIFEYPTDFFQSGWVVQAARNRVYGPSISTIGGSGADFTVELTGNPSAFYELAARAGLVLNTPARRVRYVMTFLATTQSFGVRVQFLTQFPPLRKTENTTPDQLAQFYRVQKRYGGQIKELALTDREPWFGSVFALVIWDLVRYDVKLFGNGQVEVSTTLVTDELPTCLDLGQS